MKAAVLHEAHQPMEITDVATRSPGPREVLIATAYAGLCHSDLHFIEGLFPHPLPAVLGHEDAGVVEAVGSAVTYVKPGDHFITCLSVFCGECERCLSGNPSTCSDTSVKLQPDATDALNPLESDPFEAVLELPGGGVHHAIECLGMNTTAEQAFNMLALGGTATIVGMIPADQKIAVDGMQLLRGRTLKGSSMGSNRSRLDMPRLVELYLQGRLHLDEWVSAVITLDQINDGFADMKAGKVVRSVVKFD